jgi:hypothetical protein
MEDLERGTNAYAEVTQDGRWSWRIVIHDGLMEYGPGSPGYILGWRSWGSRERAEAKAKRLIDKYKAEHERDWQREQATLKVT